MEKNIDTPFLRVADVERTYIGPERRLERRRGVGNPRVETLFKNFGFDRRLKVDRRGKETSWFLTSDKAVND